MVIRHDHIGARLLRVCNLRGVGDAAVHRDDEIGHEFIEDLIERRDAHAVTFAAFGNIQIGLDAELPERAGEHGERADPVRIVVSEQGDPPLLVARLRKELHRLPHALHEEGRQKVLRAGMKKRMHLFPRIHAPRIENARRRRRNAERRGAL